MSEARNRLESSQAKRLRNLSVLEQFMTYVLYEQGLSARTAQEYTSDLLDFARFLGKDTDSRKLLSAGREDASRFVQLLMGVRKYKVSAVKRRLASIRAFYKFARRKNLIKDNPFTDFSSPKGLKILPKVLSERDVSRLLSAKVHVDNEFLYSRDHAMFELMYATGIRIGELVGLNIRDIDREKRIMRVIGKGKKERKVIFNKTALNALNRYLAARPDISADTLFVTRQGERLTVRGARFAFAAMKKAAGIEGSATPHTLRHSFATHLLEHGANLMAIKELLGHESLSTTQIYTNLSLEHIRQTYEDAHPRDKDTQTK